MIEPGGGAGTAASALGVSRADTWSAILACEIAAGNICNWRNPDKVLVPEKLVAFTTQLCPILSEVASHLP